MQQGCCSPGLAPSSTSSAVSSSDAQVQVLHNSTHDKLTHAHSVTETHVQFRHTHGMCCRGRQHVQPARVHIYLQGLSIVSA
jgi:hypothetical protein